MFCDEVSTLLFENKILLNEWVYVKLMNLLLENYKDRFNFVFARYVFDNKKDIHELILNKIYILLQKEFNELENKPFVKQKSQQLEFVQSETSDFIMLSILIPIHIVLLFLFLHIIKMI